MLYAFVVVLDNESF